VGYLESQSPDFHTTTNARIVSLRKIIFSSCILVKKMGGEAAGRRKTVPAILRPPLPNKMNIKLEQANK
jgi:hypothetical protein